METAVNGTVAGRTADERNCAQPVASTEDGRLVIQYPFSDTEESTDDLTGTPAKRNGNQPGEDTVSPTLRPVDDAEDSEGVPDSQLDEAERAMKNEQVVMSGYLLKKGEKRRTWKSRWFVLRPTRLAYYQNDKEYELLKIIDLNEVHAIAEVDLKKRRNVFGLVTRERTYYIQATSSRVAEDWLRALRAAHHHLRQTSRSGTENGSASPTRSSTRRHSQPQGPVGDEVAADALLPPSAVSATAAVGAYTSHPHSAQAGSPHERDSASQRSAPESIATADSFLTTTTTPSSIFTDYAHSADSTPSTVVPYFPPPPLQPAIAAVPAPLTSILATSASANRELPPRLSVRLAPATPVSAGGEVSNRPPFMSMNSAASSPRFESSSSEDEDDCADHVGSNGSAGGVGSGGPLLDDNLVVIQGYLEKRLTNSVKKIAAAKGWKKRWFVLRGGRLFMYKNDGEYVVKRLIPLRSVLDILEIDAQGKHHLFCFKIVLPKRQLVLCAASASDMQTWIDSLRAVHAATRGEAVSS